MANWSVNPLYLYRHNHHHHHHHHIKIHIPPPPPSLVLAVVVTAATVGVSPLDVGTRTPLAPAVVSPIATCASGVFPSTHWRNLYCVVI